MYPHPRHLRRHSFTRGYRLSYPAENYYHTHGAGSLLQKASGKDLKGKLSPVLYAVGIAVACASPLAADAIYAFVALIWLVPDRRIEKAVT